MAVNENQELINEDLKGLSRVVIPNCPELKARMMPEVDRLGIDGNFIYPGLDGLSREIATDILAGIVTM